MIGYFVTVIAIFWLSGRPTAAQIFDKAAGIFVWSLGTVLTGYATTFAFLLSYRVMVWLG